MDKPIIICEWPRWLKVKEAALYSAIGQKRLIDLAEQKIIRGFQDPDHGHHHWIFDRLSLDDYRNLQANTSKANEIKSKALEILETVCQ